MLYLVFRSIDFMMFTLNQTKLSEINLKTKLKYNEVFAPIQSSKFRQRAYLWHFLRSFLEQKCMQTCFFSHETKVLRA